MTQESNMHLLHWQADSLPPLSHLQSPTKDIHISHQLRLGHMTLPNCMRSW